MDLRASSLIAAMIGLAMVAALSRAAWDGSQTQGQTPSTGPVRLKALVHEALDRNPGIQAARYTVEASRARIPQARAWPDPKVSFGYAGNQFPPFTLMRGDPSSPRQLMAEQEIPYPGKTRLRGQVAAREADAATLNYEAVWRRVVAEVKQAYFDLYFVHQSLLTLRKERDVLQKFEKTAEARYSVGRSAQQDAIKAQVDLSRLTERETVLEQMRRTLEAQLNSLRDLPSDTPLGTPGEVQQSDLAYSLDNLQAAAQANFPVLKRQRTLVEANRLAVELAHKEVRPNLSVGYAYMQRSGLPDMKGLTFSTTLPIFRRIKQDKAIAEAAANLLSSQRMEENELTVLRYRVKQEYLQAQAAGQLLVLYSKGIVPQSSLALESSLSTYQVGTTDFLTILSNFTTVLDYELAYHQQLAEHEKALARLEELAALDLVRMR